MRPKISRQSKSFFILFAIAVVGTYASLLVAEHMSVTGQSGADLAPWGTTDKNGNITYIYGDTGKMGQTASTTPAPAPVDTTNWKTYTNSRYQFSLKYPAGWKVTELGIHGDYYDLAINPGKNLGLMAIYINHIGFFAMEGLPQTQEMLGQDTLINVKDELYGLNHQGLYLTFDLGTATQQQPEFDAMVHSITFQ